jgi:hypothetical protein
MVKARVERSPYFSTKTSLETPVIVEMASGILHWGDVRGWLGEAVYQAQRYPDHNVIQTGYGWLLAPIVHQRRFDLQGGYGFSASNARASRFVLAQPHQPYAVSDPRFNTEGRYGPYYTPDHLQTHSVLAGTSLVFARTASFRLDASYGFRAMDNAPFFQVSGGQILEKTNSRKFSPWNARSSLKLTLREGLTLEPEAEAGRTVFYSWTTASIGISYHFPGNAASHAARK